MRSTNFNTRFSGILLFLAASGLVLAQQSAPNGGWRRANDAAPDAQQQQQDPSQPVARSDEYGQTNPNVPQADQKSTRPAYGLPPQVSVKPNTYLMIRTNEVLSSDHTVAGETFAATLLQPLVADGVVVAQRGQTVYGRVSIAEKAHGGKDSRLGLELTRVTLADGTQAPFQSQLVSYLGPRAPGAPQAGTIVGTSAAGATAGSAGVLLTHGHETRVYPESALTFQVTAPVTVSTVNAPQAFRFVGPDDYDRPSMQYSTRSTVTRPGVAVAPGYYAPGYYPYYGYGYGYGYPYWGPSVVIGGGWGYGGFYRGGFGGGFRRR